MTRSPSPKPPVGDPGPQWGTPAPLPSQRGGSQRFTPGRPGVLTPRPPLHCDGEGEAEGKAAVARGRRDDTAGRDSAQYFELDGFG
jgi:hypothetical protein